MSQLLPCFLGSACQIPAKFLLLLFLAPSFSSLCYLLSQTPKLVSKSPQLNTLPFCSPGELSRNLLTQSQGQLGLVVKKAWGSRGRDLGAAPSFFPLFLNPTLIPASGVSRCTRSSCTVCRRTWGGLDEVGLTKHPPFQLLLRGRGLLGGRGRRGQSRAEGDREYTAPGG